MWGGGGDAGNNSKNGHVLILLSMSPRGMRVEGILDWPSSPSPSEEVVCIISSWLPGGHIVCTPRAVSSQGPSQALPPSG